MRNSYTRNADGKWKEVEIGGKNEIIGRVATRGNSTKKCMLCIASVSRTGRMWLVASEILNVEKSGDPKLPAISRNYPKPNAISGY
jgi:hypothetical protein